MKGNEEEEEDRPCVAVCFDVFPSELELGCHISPDRGLVESEEEGW